MVKVKAVVSTSWSCRAYRYNHWFGERERESGRRDQWPRQLNWSTSFRSWSIWVEEWQTKKCIHEIFCYFLFYDYSMYFLVFWCRSFYSLICIVCAPGDCVGTYLFAASLDVGQGESRPNSLECVCSCSIIIRLYIYLEEMIDYAMCEEVDPEQVSQSLTFRLSHSEETSPCFTALFCPGGVVFPGL